MAIFVAMSLPGLVRAQSGADAAPVILLHPGVATVFQLPDAIAHARVRDRGEIRIAVVGDELFLRPRPATPAGMRVSLEVETRAARWTFQLVVVARARDADRMIRVPPLDARAPEASTPEAPPDEPAEPEAPALAVTPKEVPTASELPNAASPASPEPVAGPARAEPSAEHAPAANVERLTATTRVSRFDLAIHAVAGLGFTGVNIAGYWSDSALQPHHSLGLRLTGEPRSTPWAVQADVSAEWPAGPMKYQGPVSPLEVSGSRLRLELSMRASTGTKWRASAYAGIGVQVHLRRIEEAVDAPEVPESAMEQGVVLGLGVGLQYWTRGKVLLGLDFLVRQGGPDDYHSVAALLTMGRYLDQGD